MRTALITGASSGIGLELARVFARNHHQLVLVARRKEKLHEIKQHLENDHGVEVIPLPLDLIKKGATQTLFDDVRKMGLTIDVLVNNAGFGLHGAFHDTDLDTEIDMIHLNISVLTDLTKRFLPGMKKQNRGKILNVASTAAFFPGPFMAVYYATKAYVLSFSQALSYELKDTGLTVSALCPGPTDTEFQERAGVKNSNIFKGNLLPIASAQKVAEAGYRGLMNGQAVIVPGIMNKLSAVTSGLTPSLISNRLIEKLHKED